MISSINYCLRILPVLIGIMLCCGCAGTGATVPAAPPVVGAKLRIAVLPIENLSGMKAPLRELRRKLVEHVGPKGFDTVSEDELNEFMARYRIRYTGGIDEDTALAFAKDLRVEAVLITSLEYFSDSNPPRISLTARLVTTGKDPEIVWMESVGLAGNDSPGMFGLGLVADVRKLTDMALHRLFASLTAGFAAGSAGSVSEAGQKVFPPKIAYLSNFSSDERLRVVVLPFYNRSGRKYAGEIMTLHFIQELRKLGNFNIVEPGLMRNKFLQFRLIMADGVSLANADVIYDTIQSNLLVTGKVFVYFDEKGELGSPSVDFSAMAIAKANHRIVMASDSYNSGDDRVVFFDFGRINSAHGVAIEMVRGITAQFGSRFGAREGADSKK